MPTNGDAAVRNAVAGWSKREVKCSVFPESAIRHPADCLDVPKNGDAAGIPTCSYAASCAAWRGSLRRLCKRLKINDFPKDGLLACKTRPFTMQKVAFRNVKGHLLNTHPNPPEGRELDYHISFYMPMYE